MVYGSELIVQLSITGSACGGVERFLDMTCAL